MSSKIKQTDIERLIFAALLGTVSLILTRFLSMYVPVFGANTVRVGLGSLPIMLSGIFLGPFWGALTGVIADILGAVFFSGLGYFPGFTLTAAMEGLIPALLIKKYRSDPVFSKLLFPILITQAACSWLMQSLWLALTTGVGFYSLLLIRFPVALIMGFIYTAVIHVIYPPLFKVIKIR